MLEEWAMDYDESENWDKWWGDKLTELKAKVKDSRETNYINIRINLR